MTEIVKYYELKQKYQEKLNERKKKIKRNEGLTIKEKRAQIKKLIPKCVNCNKPGGTIFEEKNGTLRAICASKTPCDLNLSIKRIYYDNMRELDIKNEKTTESIKMRIIMAKLDYLFGFNNTKDETIDKFNTLKQELATINEVQLINNKKYHDIISGIHREPLLLDANDILVNEVNELKKINDDYMNDPAKSVNYLKEMVEKYISVIKPLTEKINKMKYGYYAIESKSIPFSSEKTHTLVANPYRYEQLEQPKKI